MIILIYALESMIIIIYALESMIIINIQQFLGGIYVVRQAPIRNVTNINSLPYSQINTVQILCISIHNNCTVFVVNSI